MIGDATNREEAERERRLRELTDDGEIISAVEYKRRSRRSFLSFGALGVAGYVGFNTLQNQEENERIPRLLRWGLERNDDVWSALERDGASARTFDISDREEIRVNGLFGLETELPTDYAISMRVEGEEYTTVAPDAVRALEVRDIVWEHKCVEGWANIVHWTGARFADFLEQYGPAGDDWDYISMRTPDEEYYVGIDRYTALHDQTLLAWALNGNDLTVEHGAPLRLATPFKYGIKQLKRVGIVEFTNTRPTDYWYERGYDWHAGF
ncbi:MAG: molybdopterin-dependent oxidoreductase [Ilumatobacter sp.]|uniref:molybdopterin-dependent oxidoreductase n=1 Tax=Ilumatobacter sp. TaxID=1967498 RepID=UPI00329A37A7